MLLTTFLLCRHVLVGVPILLQQICPRTLVAEGAVWQEEHRNEHILRPCRGWLQERKSEMAADAEREAAAAAAARPIGPQPVPVQDAAAGSAGPSGYGGNLRPGEGERCGAPLSSCPCSCRYIAVMHMLSWTVRWPQRWVSPECPSCLDQEAVCDRRSPRVVCGFAPRSRAAQAVCAQTTPPPLVLLDRLVPGRDRPLSGERD